MGQRDGKLKYIHGIPYLTGRGVRLESTHDSPRRLALARRPSGILALCLLLLVAVLGGGALIDLAILALG
ncbi:MAG: hypothetical protein PVG82_05465 [Chromatiales bacterium]|jgi:hypothetical protein